MNCYFQGCTAIGTTKEHVPPRSFFPEGEKEQLLTVKSCKQHNNLKSTDDLYALAQICMNASPNNRAREVWQKKIAPQLNFNNGALRKTLAADSIPTPNGVKYRVDIRRIDNFFFALSCGIIYKTCNKVLPNNYLISHIYHNFESETKPPAQEVEFEIERLYSGKPMDILNFGEPGTRNERIYTATIWGVPGYQSSITIVHIFFGVFKVTSMLTYQPNI